MISLRFQKKLNAPSGKMKLEVDANLESGKFHAIYGPSGAGKTTTLRIIAGLEHPDEGSITVNDEIWLDTSTGINKIPQKRNVGFVFQDYALFPNMTVRKNLLFSTENARHADELIELMRLGDLRHTLPATLSGGQQQRVALARALAQKSELLLLDEPFSAVSEEMRHDLRQYLKATQRAAGCTCILVTHDIASVISMSEYAIEIQEGKLVKKGAPADLFSDNPEQKGKLIGEVIGEKDGMQLILIGQQVISLQLAHFKPGDKIELDVNSGKVQSRIDD